MPLIGIKPKHEQPDDSAVNSVGTSGAKRNGQVITYPTSRFAVASFDAWSGIQATLQDLSASGSRLSDPNCLGLHRVLAQSGGALAAAAPALELRGLPFQNNAELIGCTSGPVADRLAWRLALGAPTLKSALAHWLIPRHAAHLQNAVENGRIVLWLQLFDNDDERRAYQSLLARSSNSVGVHDLPGGETQPPPAAPKH
jgi:hypothetical protein